MYKAPGNPFGSFGTDRKAAIDEFLKQLGVIDEYLSIYDRCILIYTHTHSYTLIHTHTHSYVLPYTYTY